MPSMPILCALLGLTAFLVVYRYTTNPRPPYPPGPPPKPLIGNAFDIPLKKPWVKYLKMSQEYRSNIIHLSAFRTHVVVLNTKTPSSCWTGVRPTTQADQRVEIGFQDITFTAPYGNFWRKQRRLLEKGLKKDSMPSYHHVQAEKVHLLLEQLLDHPVEFKEHCKTLGTGITMAMGFGYDIIPGETDALVEPAEFAVANGAELTLPGRTLVAIFGFLKYIPPWVPGASAQKLGAQIRAAAVKFKNEPYGTVKRNMATGMAKDCILKALLEANMNEDGSIIDEDAVKNAVAGLYLAAVESMQSAQTVFIMAMTLYPEAQKKAQEEIDRVIGSARLPAMADRVSLPYVEALYREVLRWRPVSNLSFAHVNIEDDTYKGFHIPKGSIVMPNVWAISRNEETYPDPECFKPERYFRGDGTLNDDTFVHAFGFGRRICPGRFMADSVVWLMVASVLAIFNISKAKDENGNEIGVNPNAFTDSFASHPIPFRCSIVPRSKQADLLVRNAASIARQSLKKP